MPSVAVLVFACAAVAQTLPPASPGLPEAPLPRDRIEGRVLDGLGQPLAAADVWVIDPEDHVVARSKSDGAGLFVLGRLPERLYWRVCATAPGRTEAYSWARPRNGVAVTQVKLFDAATLTGRVVDAKGEGIPGAEVLASFQLSRVVGGEGPTGTTDAAGRFRIDKVPLGMINVRAAASGFVCDGVLLHVAQDCETTVKLTAGEGLAIDVEVEGLSPEEARTVQVSLRAYAAGGLLHMPPRLRHGRIDDQGRWPVRGLPELMYVVAPTAPGLSFQPREVEMYPQFQGGFDSMVKPASTLPTARFRAFRTSQVTVRGRLLDDRGRGLVGETLVTRAYSGGVEATALTGMDGAFTVASPLAPGSDCVFFLRRSKWVTDQKQNVGSLDGVDLHWHLGKVDPTAELVIRAIPAALVRGRLLDTGGCAVPFAEVQIEGSVLGRTPQWRRFRSTSSLADGSFEIPLHADAGPVRMLVEGGAGFVVSKGVELRPGATLDVGELKLSPPATISGVVRDHAQKPLPGARVWLLDWDASTRQQRRGSLFEAVTDRAGRFRFAEVAPGGAWLQVGLSLERLQSRAVEPFDVAVGATLVFDLVLDERQ